MAEGVNKVVKFMLFAFNFIFFLCGAIIIIGCSLTFANFSFYADYTGSVGLAVIIVFICLGVFILLTGFFGCCGAMRENYCMLFTYAVIIFAILVVEIGAGTAAFLLQDDISNEIDKNMSKELEKYPSASNASRDVFDSMQQGLKCCGANNYTDWFDVYNPGNNHSVPQSCCINGKTCDSLDIPDDPEEAGRIIYTKGCAQSLKDFLQSNMMAIIIACICIGLVQITGIFCSCCLMKSIKNDYEVV